ncbi:hypothetical protein [Leptotrichia wadei]|uniref:hypothetical protein n=1 Tax=Leptotrichia wadei TaxID=157687 RepID=UPI0028DCE508|nr:hypothetical protein [Leptotrichia wadei]
MDYNYEMRWCDYNSIMEVSILSGCLMFIRTDILKNVGIFVANVEFGLRHPELKDKAKKYLKKLIECEI